MEGAVDEGSAHELYGVSLVSGFYGKGSWTAWCMLVASTIVSKLFTVEQDTSDKYCHICGLDINLVGSFAYPFIAAVDLLLHMHHFFNDSAVQDMEVARIDASLVVLREGIVFGFFLLLACAFGTRKSKHQNRGLAVYFSGTCVLLFLIINRLFDLGYCRFGWQSYVDGWLMMPYHRVFAQPQSTLAAKYTAFARAFRNRKNGQEGPPFWSIGLFVHTNLVAEILCKASMLRIDLFINMTYPFRKIARLHKQAEMAKTQREIEDLSKQIESYKDTGHAIGTPDIGESSRAIAERQSDIELNDMSQHKDLKAQFPLEPEHRSSRLRPPDIAECERPRRPRSLVSMALIGWITFMQDLQPTYLYLFINCTDKIRAIFVTGPPIDWTALGVFNIPPLGATLANPVLTFVLRGTVLWQALRALADIVLTFGVMISHMAWMMPVAESKFKDLDQMSALVTAGVLPLVYSIGTALCGRFGVVEKIKDKLHIVAVKKGKVVNPSCNF